MFQYQLEAFFSQYILSPTHPLGDITDFVIKIEFKMRGIPHVHCLLWVKNAPKINHDSDEVVCQFIDKYITGTLPNNNHRNKHDINLFNEFNALYRLILDLFGKWTSVLYKIWIQTPSNRYSSTCYLAP